MKTIKTITVTGILAAALCAVPATAQQQPATPQQNADQAARAAQSGQPVTNPGYGNQVPNDAVQSGGTPQSNSSYQKDRNGSQGFDLGWMGLLGLIGLFGLARKRGKIEEPAGNPTARNQRTA